MKIKIENFNLKEILLSGACFRAIEENDGSFTNILFDRVINIKQDNNYLIIESNNNKDLKNVIFNYFDLNCSYNIINEYLIDKDEKMLQIVDCCKCYRILNQDKFEMGISYIISQNNNVKRISKSINELCKDYGEKVVFKNKEYYLFPKYETLSKLSVEDFRKYGVGFRDKYIKDYLNNYNNLNIEKLNTQEALNKLMQIKGIGLKVASCILLFGYGRKDVFPIDTWVKKNILDLYSVDGNINHIKEFIENKFGKYSGVAIQYLFHSKRNKNML